LTIPRWGRITYMADMPTFRTSEELAVCYAVSAERLLAYAARGNLSMCWRDGAALFDEARVARLFPKKQGLGTALCPPHRQPGFGTLGRLRLGEQETAAD
jgi:hypothetical protein